MEGDWNANVLLVQGVFLARIDDPRILIRAGVGVQHVGTSSFIYEETGTQLIILGDPPYAYGDLTRSLTQQEMRSSGTAYSLGLALTHQVGRRVQVLGSVDMIFGEVHFKGTQTRRFDGATQSDPDYHYVIDYDVDRPNGTTRLLLQLGFAVGLFR